RAGMVFFGGHAPHCFGSLILADPLPGTSVFVSSLSFRPPCASARVAYPIRRFRDMAAGLVAARGFERAGRLLAARTGWRSPATGTAHGFSASCGANFSGRLRVLVAPGQLD